MEIDFNRIAVKVGSNVLTRRDGTLDVTRMSALVDQIAELHKAGIEIILVSSGAVASGRSEVRPTKKLDSVDQRQLFSAVGQAKLINRYYELFREHGIPVGQVLTMKENFSTRRHYLNQKNCMTVMLENGVIPIVNENDTISVSELMFTDNDELSGLIASMMDAQALIILSNIDGIYNGSPADPESQVIREIEQGKDLSSYIQTSKSSFGRGGMLTKTNIARKVADEGITVIIANGKRDNILVKIMNNEELIMNNGERVESDSPLALMAFQERLEELCWLNGGMKQTAPAQRMVDFVNKKNSFDLPESSYTPGLLASPLHFWMPEFVTSRLREGFRYFGKVSKGFLTNDAVMIGVETRTSSPVRILRDKESYQHITLKGLFPCGEGAGYAGGIVSAAIDGERCAEGAAGLSY